MGVWVVGRRENRMWKGGRDVETEVRSLRHVEYRTASAAASAPATASRSR